MARRAGYPRPILHGLCTYGVAAHAIVRAAAATTPRACLFSAPVYPGETLQCDIWRLPDGQVRFLARALERGVVVMSNGTAEVRA